VLRYRIRGQARESKPRELRVITKDYDWAFLSRITALLSKGLRVLK